MTKARQDCRSAAFRGIGIAVFCVMLLLNFLTPYLADDYTFAFSFRTGQRLTGLASVFDSQLAHYFQWSGRFIIKLLAQWFTTVPKALFNVCNAAVYTGLGLLVCALATEKDSRRDPLLLGLIYLSLWEFAPVFGQTNLWMCGSLNYLWATFFCVAALLPYARYSRAPFAAARWMPVTAFFLGLVGGWSSENTSAGLLAGVVLCMIFCAVQKQRLPLWMWTGFVGGVLGFALLILAPGNYMRHDTAPDTRSMATILATRLLTALDMLWTNGAVLIVLFAVLFCLACMQGGEPRQLFVPAMLFAAAMAANFAMVLSPVYYPRSTHGVLTLLTAACATCLPMLAARPYRMRLACLAAAGCCLAAVQLVQAGYDIASFAMMRRVREGIIRQEIAAGETDIRTYAIEPYTRWCGGYGLPDLRPNTDDWLSTDTARYYGINSITADSARTYPFPGKTNLAFETGEIAN